jgi:outer membrane protein OmpA-like peptidoglycan-associated protein
MNAFRALATRSTVVGLGLIALIAAERPLQARQAEPLLQPTPLVLKDGRIASVSIHTVPFAPGRADLSGEAAARVAELTRAVGTDCFLTAQVIGHIDAGEVSQDDTLNAHRLARSRADAVQASLIGGGLPAKAIASVWDWQFMVRAPRATLWIFQLTAGEDCEGRPLHGALVAQPTPSRAPSAGQPERAAASSSERTATTTARAAAQTDATARAAAPAPSARTKAQPEVRAEPPAATPAPTAAQMERLAPAKLAERRETGTAVAARPALAPKAQTSDGQVEQPASQPETAAAPATKPAPVAVAPAPAGNVEQPAKPRETGTVVAAKPASAASPPASDGKVESGDGRLVITFATNSSYFPAGATRRLRQLIAGLESGSKYQVSVQVAVSGSTKVVGARSPQEAAAYNKWLAERRLERVENWLREHAAAALTFKPEYVTDESRQVVVQLAPTG